MIAIFGLVAAAGVAVADTQYERARHLCLDGGGVLHAAERASRAGWMDLPPAVAEAWGGSSAKFTGLQSRVLSDAKRFSILMVYADPDDSERHICALEESPGEAELDRKQARAALGISPRRTRENADIYVVGQLPDGTIVTDTSAAGQKRVTEAAGDYTTVMVVTAKASQKAQFAGTTMTSQGLVSMVGFSQPDRLSRPQH